MTRSVTLSTFRFVVALCLGVVLMCATTTSAPGAADSSSAATAIEVVLDLVPDDHLDVPFVIDGQQAFSLDDDTDPTLPASRTDASAAGQYLVGPNLQLKALEGYKLETSCVDPDGGSSINANGIAEVDLDAGETVSCTFTMTLNESTVRVELDVVPEDAHDFSFDTPQSFVLDDDSDPTLPNFIELVRAPGQIGVRLSGSLGQYALTAIDCTDPDGGTTTIFLSERTVIVDLDAGELVSCVYRLTKQTGTVEIALDAIPDDPQDFSFNFGDFSLDDDSDPTLPASKQFELAAGQYLYRLTSGAAAPWAITDIRCTDPDGGSVPGPAGNDLIVDLDAGETVSCTFELTKADTEPPALTLPASFTVDATSTAGAMVTYAASASDDIDPSPTVTCGPPSGSLFPIGATVVNCTATDEAGNSAQGSFTITVRGAGAQITALIAKTEAFVDSHLIEAALKTTLRAASQALAAGRKPVACAAMAAYIIGVRAVPSRYLTAAQKSELIADATRIRAVIGC
jgi:hypothetical protein